MNNNFETMLEEFSSIFELAKKSANLEELKDHYISFETKRETIFDWIMDNNSDDETRSEFLTKFAHYEHDLWVDSETKTLIGEIPIFDDSISFEDIEKMFEDYGSYFQRYGCLIPDQIVSWDKDNVLFNDDMGNVEIIKRPDVIVNGNN
jgi:hypothetical protein